MVSLNCYSQLRTEAVSIFKMNLFLDKKNSDFRGMNPLVVKNDSLYKEFSNLIRLKLDTLKVYGDYNLINSSVGHNLMFFKVSVGVNNKNNITYVRELTSEESQFFGFFANVFDTYVIAINQKNGKCYKLEGFGTNDFLGFLSDFKEEYNGELSTKHFLKNYRVEGLDFECLYKGLKSKKRDIKKFPCLTRVSDDTIFWPSYKSEYSSPQPHEDSHKK